METKYRLEDSAMDALDLRPPRSMGPEDVRRLLPRRDRYAHKGMFGKITLVCGSTGFTGAAAMAARAALRCGSGLVTLCVPEAIYPIAAAKLDEAMVQPLPCDGQGRLSRAALEPLAARLPGCDALLIGPGLGRSDAVTELCLELLRRAGCPVVLDADGLNAVSGHIDEVRGTACPKLLTPHDGEFLRLAPTAQLPRQEPAARAQAAAALARMLGAVVLLKGHRTVITDGNELYVNQTGNPGMATGGSGDVLAGILVSLLGQGLPLLEAGALGAWLHGAAGDLCAETLGEYSLLPTDMIEALPRLLK